MVEGGDKCLRRSLEVIRIFQELFKVRKITSRTKNGISVTYWERVSRVVSNIMS